jgi:glycosyltransferase involved in cell wall biosynthesis
MSDLVSIIIRGKNEEDWLGLCLKSINHQSYKNFEVIYVDNQSDDSSVNIAHEYSVAKIKEIKKFLPGKAINMGIKASKGKFLVMLSAHCIPVDKHWLKNMVKAIKNNNNTAGVYGRQLPLPSTSSDDARDLLITFGNEDRLQKKDPFFHNANSIIRRSVWNQVKFDNSITNIEDRDWAKKVIDLGYNIKYDAQSAVYHFHGLHQHNNYESFRASAVNTLIQKINKDDRVLPSWLETQNRECPIVFYGNAKNVELEINRYLNANEFEEKPMFFYYGSVNPEIDGIIFLKRRVSKKAIFHKFTKDILELINQEAGHKIEAVSFVDLKYQHFIKNSYLINKEKVFQNNIHLSAFAYIDKGDIWTNDGDKIKPIKDMFDSSTQFLRVAFGQGSIIRASSIRINKSIASDGFANTFKDIKFLIRQ